MQLPAIVNKAGLSLKKHSPEILIGFGIAGVIASTVMACKATRKLDDILEKHDGLMERARAEETPEQVKKSTAMVYAHTAGSLAKLYAPAVALGVVSLGCIVGSNQILRKRNAALAASCAALNKGWKEYRQRVVDRFGDDVEKQIFYNLQPEEVEETVTDDKGKEKTVKKTVGVVGPNGGDQFTRYFTKGNVNWKPDWDYNKTLISLRQSYFNDVLRAKKGKPLTVNEVFRELGFAECKEGMTWGWIFDPDNPDLQNEVRITVTEVFIPNEMGGRDRALALDFNVDGNVYDMMT